MSRQITILLFSQSLFLILILFSINVHSETFAWTLDEEKYISESCGSVPDKIFKGVTLKYGAQAGAFHDAGRTSNIKECAILCCSEKSCDIAFMLDNACYLVTCYSQDSCDLVVSATPSEHKPTIATMKSK